MTQLLSSLSDGCYPFTGFSYYKVKKWLSIFQKSLDCYFSR